MKKLSARYGNRRFINVFARARNFVHTQPGNWSVQIRDFPKYFLPRWVSAVGRPEHLVQSSSRRNTSCQLSATAYTLYSHIFSISNLITRRVLVTENSWSREKEIMFYTWVWVCVLCACVSACAFIRECVNVYVYTRNTSSKIIFTFVASVVKCRQNDEFVSWKQKNYNFCP